MAQSGGLAGVRGLLEHSLFLVSGASQSGVLEVAAAIALPRPASGLGDDVGSAGPDHSAMAAGCALFERMAVGSGIASVWHWIVVVFAVEPELQRAATEWFAGGLRPWRTTVGGDGDSRAGTASGLFGASLRNAGVEHRDWARGLLHAYGVCGGYWHRNDSDGRQGTGTKIRGRISPVQSACAGCIA